MDKINEILLGLIEREKVCSDELKKKYEKTKIPLDEEVKFLDGRTLDLANTLIHCIRLLNEGDEGKKK